MKKTLFIDGDGTILKENGYGKADSLARLDFIRGVISALAKIAAETDYELVLVTRQSISGTPSLTEEDFLPLHSKMLEILRGEGVTFTEICMDQSLPDMTSAYVKSETNTLFRYLSKGIDLDNSYIVSVRKDISQLATKLGCKAVLISGDEEPGSVLSAETWNEIYSYLKEKPRKSTVSRNSSETKIAISLNLDGTGKYRIRTGSGFFTHMLEQFARHSGIDLIIEAAGDTFVDEHHIIEDTGIALGEAFISALGSKKGIERYGFVLPMDDSVAHAAVDFGGRSWLLWQVEFREEKIGTMPTGMIYHFFRSFSDSARCNISIKAEGLNEHHKAEAIFKAFARAVRMAIRRTGNSELPSTKGLL